MDTSKMTNLQRRIYFSMHDFMIHATIEQMEDAMDTYDDDFTKSVIQHMIDTCKKHQVDYYGRVPCYIKK